MKFKLLVIIATLFFCSNIFGQFILDDSFSGDGFLKANPHTGSNDYAITSAIEKLSDGKYLVAGSALGVTPGLFVMTVQKYNADGSVDTTFANNGVFALDINGLGSVGRGLAIQPDGKIIVAGFSIVAVPGTTGVHRETVVRLNSNGSFDTSFAGDGIFVQPHPINTIEDLGTEAFDVDLMANGDIVVSGQHKPRTASAGHHPCGNSEGPVPRCSTIAGYSPDGTVLFRNYFDFGVGVDSEFLADIEIQPDGKIVGAIGNSVSINDFSVVRFFSNGEVDATFGTNGLARTSDFFGRTDLNPRNVEIQPDGKILLTGNTNGLITARFNADGTLDNSYGTGGKTPSLFTGTGRLISGESTIILPDGKVLTNGTFDKLIRLNSDGSPDNSFGQNGVQTISPASRVNHITDMVREPNGKITYTSRTTLLAPGQGPVDEWLVGRLTDTSQNQAKFDFDGDNKTDIGIFRPAPGEWWYQRSSDNVATAFQFGAGTDVITPADFTGDGATDVAFFRPSSGEWFVLRSEDNSFFSFPFGTNGDIPIPADYDGDGIADPAVFRPSIATWFILNSGGGVTTQQFGLNGDAPVPSDYDGDGKTDLAIFRPTAAEWYYQRSTDFQVNGFQFGIPNDTIPVQSDYTGDGKTDIAFFRSTTSEWFVLRSEDSSFFAFPFGTNGDIPVPGDYDGDGTADPAVFRPSSNTWFLNQSINGSAAIQFGITNDIPIPSAYIP